MDGTWALRQRNGGRACSRYGEASAIDAGRISGNGVWLDRPFGRGEIADVRHRVAGLAAQVGLAGDRLEGFVLSVNEVVTNVILHAGGTGKIRLRTSDGFLCCTVLDLGPGIPERAVSPSAPPRALEISGRGIWLAHQFCDMVIISTGRTGTSIELRTAIDGSDDRSAVGIRSPSRADESP